jgi:DeoR/GlpR family transcriptional regulator of sugar metabolism
VDSGLAEMLGTSRWAVYRLAIKQVVDKQTSIQFEFLSTPPISDKTAQKDLSDLENKGMIKRTGKARNTRYELSENTSG